MIREQNNVSFLDKILKTSPQDLRMLLKLKCFRLDSACLAAKPIDRAQDRKISPAPGTNQIAGFAEFRALLL